MDMRLKFFHIVIPGRAQREPGIHSLRLWLLIPGLRLSAHPGMTTERGRKP